MTLKLVTTVMAALILLLASLVVATQAFQCPMSCRCFTSNQAACNNTTLFELPQEFDANLTHLIFNYNNLTLLRNTTFEKTPWISELYLEGNRIRHIEPDTFRHLQNLSTLSLLDNNISNIHPDTFMYNSKLKVLILKGNYLHLNDRTTFLNSNSLLELVLSSCYIDYLPNEAFRGLPNLLSLKLDFNQIHWLNFYSFSPLIRLTELRLNDNKLESLRNYPKTPALMSLRNVDLSNNYLNTLGVDVLEQMVNVVKLDLTNNHLVCICNLTAAYDWLTSRRVVTEATCFAPSSVRGRDWMVLRTMNCGGQVSGRNGTTIWGNSSSSYPNQQGSNWGPNVATQGSAGSKFDVLVPITATFVARKDSGYVTASRVDGLLLVLVVLLSLTSSQELRTPCPSPCECTEHLVDCSLRSLAEIPRDLPDTTIALTAAHNNLTTITTNDFPRTRPKLQSLYLNNNTIRYLEINAFGKLDNLKVLDLQGNLIRAIEPRTFINNKNIIKLVLSSNEIYKLDLGTFEGLDGLEDLRLDKNTIKTIDSNTFRHSPRLKKLVVSWNRDLNLPVEGLYFSTPSLTWLEMDHCNLSSLSLHAFDNMTNLSYLRLKGNRLQREDLRAIRRLRSLKFLHLENNAVGYVHPNTFDDISLEWLYLRGNGLYLVRNQAFLMTPSLIINSSTCKALRIEEMDNANKKLQPANRMLPSVKRGDKLTTRVDNQSESDHETDVEVFSGMSKIISKGDLKFFGDFDVFNESLEFNQSSRSLQTTIEKYTFLTIIYVATGAASIIIFIFLITLSLDCFIAKRRYKVLKKKASKKTAEGKSSLEFQKNKRKSNTSQTDASRTKAPELKPLQGNFRRQNPQGRKSQRPRQRDSISSRSGGDNPRYITSSVNVDDVEPTTYRPHELWSRQFREHAESSVNGTPPPYVESLTPTDMTDSPSRPPQPWGRQFSGETVGESVQAGSESPRFFTSVSGSTLSSPASPKYPAHNLWSRQFR
uniref:LRRNT domain-containing protein n=1 Tax=Timema monikensis TaxID=170555 RepID=A0A7R9E5L8_9NEOP|nr:unnamed protein product [Timema monikensis]